MLLQEELVLLVRLILAHFLTDFVLQPVSWVKDRKQKKFKSPKLYLHIIVTTVIAWFFSGLWLNWWLPLIIFITHLLIDIWKSYQKDKVSFFLVDQFLHLGVIFTIWTAIFNKWSFIQNLITAKLTDPQFLTIVTAYILVTWPLGLLIGMSTERWRREAEGETPGLIKAGLWIGLLERFLIFTFILIDQYTAIGLLIAAKSILRFSDKEHNTQKKTEYVLIGTLMSFSVSVVLGILTHLLTGV